ncbi:MAG: 2-amino-4-hydroxy-6-hydroxymethyldihydropteridine diphosphokinase [Desulfobacteraceae bacterium]|nr:2-amino-4-hydroxy-6-hydroxymethyldihydropteridine diphosphokinase [Desulfobacteraceae bacterium]
MFTAYISIGSNIGNKKKNLEAAIELLGRDEKIQVRKVSPFYRTEPQNFKDQDWFVNGAVQIDTQHEVDELLTVLKTIERDLDKAGKSFRWGPRIIDLDIVYYEDLVLETGQLTVPHPRMHERCFVLRPLCDIGPSTIHPVLKMKSTALLKSVEKDKNQTVLPLKEEE